MPTLIRKNGMKMAFPTNSMRFISDDVETYRGILTDKTVEYILNNYQVVSVDSQGRSLWKLI